MTDEQAKVAEEINGGAPKIKWAAFVDSVAAEFFTRNDLEKMSIEDGRGNKAKFSRTKDNGIKVEYSSTMIL